MSGPGHAKRLSLSLRLPDKNARAALSAPNSMPELTPDDPNFSSLELNVTLVLPGGTQALYRVPSGQTIQQLKRKLCDESGLDFCNIALYHEGTFLMDPLSFNDFPKIVAKRVFKLDVQIKDQASLPLARSSDDLLIALSRIQMKDSPSDPAPKLNIIEENTEIESSGDSKTEDSSKPSMPIISTLKQNGKAEPRKSPATHRRALSTPNLNLVPPSFVKPLDPSTNGTNNTNGTDADNHHHHHNHNHHHHHHHHHHDTNTTADNTNTNNTTATHDTNANNTNNTSTNTTANNTSTNTNTITNGITSEEPTSKPCEILFKKPALRKTAISKSINNIYSISEDEPTT